MSSKPGRSVEVTAFSILPAQKEWLDTLPSGTKSAFVREAIELLKQKRYLEDIRNS